MTSESTLSFAEYNQFSLQFLLQKKYIPSWLRWIVTGSSLVKVLLHATQVSIILSDSFCRRPPVARQHSSKGLKLVTSRFHKPTEDSTYQ